MSFKDVRDLVEHLKLLGYPNMFPMQALATNFGCLASFHVVAEILQWLAELLEPGIVLTGSLQTEEERVLFVRSATEFFVTKSAIKLNPRKLYAASSITAAELQKITRLLVAPTQSEEEKDDDESYRSLNQVDIGDKMDDLRRARELSSDMTKRGANLHDLLTKEMHNKEERLAQANRPMELASVERTLKNAIAASQVKLQSTRAQLENARVEMNALNSKLQRKRAELERTKQRLEALQKIRPAHMQEFEDCEKELKELFQKFFLRLHVRDSLRLQLEARIKRTTPSPSPVIQKPTESSIPFIPEGLLADDDDNIDEAELDINDTIGIRTLDAEIPDIRDEDLMLREAKDLRDDVSKKTKRPGTATSRLRPTVKGRGRKLTTSTDADNTNQRRVTGDSMLSNRATIGKGTEDGNDDSSFGSSESDLDLSGLIGMSISGSDPSARLNILRNMDTHLDGLGDDDDDELGLASIDDISISNITGELPLRPKTANKAEHHSDEDF